MTARALDSRFNSRLRDLVRSDGVARMWCAGHEIVRRIFVTVRDEDWKEVPPTHWSSEIDEAQCIATLTARHVSDSVDFEWKGVLRVGDDLRSLQFQIVGKTLRDMQVCRLGLVVLHPVEQMIGSQLMAIGPQAGHRLTAGGTISPQPVVDGTPLAMTEPFSKLVVERADFGRLEFQFEGDLFELEDQRNWGDVSFKTYCTPLRLGFPRSLKAGASIAQSVEVRFRPSEAKALRAVVSPGTQSGIFPRIGREWRRPVSDLLPWDHVFFEVDSSARVTALRASLESSSSTKLTIGFEVVEDSPSPEILALLSAHRKRISCLVLYGPGASLPSAAKVERWRGRLEEAGVEDNMPLLAGTRGYFVEFNRGLPFDAAASGLAFPLTATVHSDDAETIGENVPAIRSMVDAARDLTEVARVCVIPLALYHPRSLSPQKFPADLIAPWLAATLVYAAQGRVAFVTLAEDVLESIDASRLSSSSLISQLLECAGLEVVLLGNKLAPGLHAGLFKARSPAQNRVLAANLNPQAVAISLPQLGFDAKAALNAVTGESIELNTGRLDIPGFSVAWIEVSEKDSK